MTRQIQEIYAVSKETQGAFFDVNSIREFCCQDDCIKWKQIQFYGLESELTDIDYEGISEGDLSMLKEIAEIDGYLILGRQINAEGELIHDICDDVDEDLEYLASALEDSGEPLDVDPAKDIFYIREFSMSENFPNLLLKARIIEELPYLCLRLFHIKPDLLAFFPSPVDYDVTNKDDEERKRAVIELARQKVNAEFLDWDEEEREQNKNVINLGEVRKFSEDELSMIMGRRRAEMSYPDNAKDSTEFEFYKSSGFIESRDSRLLYKIIEE